MKHSTAIGVDAAPSEMTRSEVTTSKPTASRRRGGQWAGRGLGFAALAIGLMTVAGGCGKVIEELKAAQGSVASFESTSELSHTASLYTDSLRSVQATTEAEYVEEASTKIYEALQASFVGCVTPFPDDNDPKTVGAQFNCTGTNGLFTITGTLEGTLTPTLEGLKVVGSTLSLASNNLVVSNRPMEGTIQLVYTISTDTAAVTLDFDITDPKVGVVAVGLIGVIEPVEACLKFEGDITAAGEQFTSQVAVSQFERCEGSCPSAGGQAVAQITDTRGEATLTIQFDGSDAASVTSSRGRTFEVELTCGQ